MRPIHFQPSLVVVFAITAILGYSRSMVLRKETGVIFSVKPRGDKLLLDPNDAGVAYNDSSSPGEFPMCTDLDTLFPPFCLPQHETDVVVGATYYVTWNADFYPLNATIIIEIRYSHSTQGDSAFSSPKTDNSYGYISLHMEDEWLQEKPENALTLYIIEFEPTSGHRASARQGPTITLHSKTADHYKPPPAVPVNKTALYIGLPVGLGVCILVVAGLYFGMRDRRRIGLGNVMGNRRTGYGIGKSKHQLLLGSETELESPGNSLDVERYSEDYDSGQSEMYSELERTASYAFKRDPSKLKSWQK
ncbi:hypothetical protein FE257_006324 [Aspergillus nanangensis]|uniref:Uncharacterized protein n=1 Tax=Aspergillus nanangensis TaxID=2582783 RepID=A0AAD4CQW3_ASPNN|nr:hypothetical protein FE257_006324 [Aspergillus nanangensis]